MIESRHTPILLAALERIERAARHRDSHMGDPMRLLETKAELREATEQARAALGEK